VEGAWRIVVPLRLSDAKSRLSAQPAPRRRDLVIAMALDVIVAALGCPEVREVVLVADQAGIDAVEASGVRPARVQLDSGAGLNAAILAGAADARGPVAALLADVPCATPEALTTALAACTAGALIASDAEGIGTTLLAARDIADFQPRFGTRSRSAHVAAGAAEVADPSPGALAGLRRDVDSEVDLWDAQRLGLGAFTRAVLSDS
jgi:2-phospho-L-lactate guanylyltransferase